jgi:hypothetical protein
MAHPRQQTPRSMIAPAMKALALIAGFVLFASSALPQQSKTPDDTLPSESEEILRQIRARPPAWLFPADACPADVMPETEWQADYGPRFCRTHLGSCLEQCREDDASACYALARAIEDVDINDSTADPVYLRACRLGIASGCTNRASRMTYFKPVAPGADRCAARTFEKTCEWGDAWGCTMYGRHLISGAGVQRNLDLAARVLRKSCLYDETFEACTIAKDLLKEIGDTKPTARVVQGHGRL